MEFMPEILPHEIPTFLAGSLIAALGVWLLRAAMRDATGRAFAALLVAVGAYAALEVAGHGPRGDLFAVLSTYLLFAVPLLAILFVATYRARARAATVPRWVLPSLGAAFAALSIAYAMDRTLFIDPEGVFDFGPLWALRGVPGLVFCAMALLLAQDYFRESHWAPRQGTYFLTMGFALAGIASVAFGGGLGLLELGGFEPREPPAWATLAESAGFVSILVLFIAMISSAVRNKRPGDRARGFVFVGALVAVNQVGAVIAPFTPEGDGLFRLVWNLELLRGVGLLAFAALGAYAAFRHRALGLDATMRTGIKVGTLSAAFLGVGFVVSESAALVLGERYGAVVGIGTAGAMLVALQPLHRAAERVAAGALPEARPLAELGEADRVALYREQVELSWADDALTRGERLRLDRLRERLGLSAEVASRVENEIASGTA